MSDTPRTDDNIARGWQLNRWVEFARQLERELTAANEQIASDKIRLTSAYGEADFAKNVNAGLDNTITGLRAELASIEAKESAAARDADGVAAIPSAGVTTKEQSVAATPRTDAEFKREGHIYIHTDIGAMEYVSLDFARSLERRFRAVERGEVLVPMSTITHLMEYWNGSRNDSAMWDALNHIMDELEKLRLAAAKEKP